MATKHLVDDAVSGQLWFDGSSKGNPGPSAWGCVLDVVHKSGRVIRHTRAQPIGHATCNMAEFGGLIGGLELAREVGAADIFVRGDSALILHLVFGSWKLKAPHLISLREKAVALAKTVRVSGWKHVCRSENALADRLANDCLRMEPSLSKTVHKAATNLEEPQKPVQHDSVAVAAKETEEDTDEQAEVLYVHVCIIHSGTRRSSFRSRLLLPTRVSTPVHKTTFFAGFLMI